MSATVLPPIRPAGQAALAQALRDAVAATAGPGRPATLAAMDDEIGLMLRRQAPDSDAASLLQLARAALLEARATRH